MCANRHKQGSLHDLMAEDAIVLVSAFLLQKISLIKILHWSLLCGGRKRRGPPRSFSGASFYVVSIGKDPISHQWGNGTLCSSELGESWKLFSLSFFEQCNLIDPHIACFM